MDRAQLADLLRTRREALQPEDVGLPRGPRRRTSGLRREEVAALCGMSADYYGRLEQQRGPQPSEQMLGAIARGLRLTLDERDHLFRLAGHHAPGRVPRNDHVSPGLMRVLDRLQDTPAVVMNGVGETLLQTSPAVALLGDQTQHTGLARNVTYRWFTDPRARAMHPEDEHERHARAFTADLREAYARPETRDRATEVVEALLATSPEFAGFWAAHEVGRRRSSEKTFVHPELGRMQLFCQLLFDLDLAQALLVFTATPGSESHEKLQLLSVIGAQRLG
ncbi:helix-turn-helix transcriptional regulator [Angustibacter aerolatus]